MSRVLVVRGGGGLAGAYATGGPAHLSGAGVDGAHDPDERAEAT
ncbi:MULTISPECIES: hypothetical protein [unclassified Streptomyces]|nr:hypothetical protein OG395_52255 [Streptomyces sp. NBC_01320]